MQEHKFTTIATDLSCQWVMLQSDMQLVKVFEDAPMMVKPGSDDFRAVAVAQVSTRVSDCFLISCT